MFRKYDLEVEEGAKACNEINDLDSEDEGKEEEKKKANSKFWINL